MWLFVLVISQMLLVGCSYEQPRVDEKRDVIRRSNQHLEQTRENFVEKAKNRTKKLEEMIEALNVLVNKEDQPEELKRSFKELRTSHRALEQNLENLQNARIDRWKKFAENFERTHDAVEKEYQKVLKSM